MKTLYILLISFMTTMAFSETRIAKMICTKGNNIFTAKIDTRTQTPTMYELELNYPSDPASDPYGGHHLVEEILSLSPYCEDGSGRLSIGRMQIYICVGELFAVKGIYGQVLMTNGSIKVFKNILAHKAGWSCK